MPKPTFENFFNLLTRNTKFDFELRALPSQHRLFTRDYADIKNFLEKHRNENCFFGVNTRYGGGKKEHVKEIVALYADIDFKDYANPTIALKALDRINHEPTVIVSSGHGVHVYWVLDKAYYAHEHCEEVEEIVRGIALSMDSDLSVAEIARVMRVPGSKNWKDKDKPRTTEIEHFNEEKIYNLSQFTIFREKYRESVNTATEPSNKIGATDLREIINLINKSCKFMQHCYQDRESLSEPFWYTMISNLSRSSQKAVDLCHVYSEGHKSYSRTETKNKILEAMNGSSPHTCKHIRNNLRFDCGSDCVVSSPIVLINKKLKGDTISVEKQHISNVKPDRKGFNIDNDLIPETAFPFEAFPDPLMKGVQGLSRAFHVHPEMVASTMLAILSAAIGHTVAVSPKTGFSIAPFIWLINIAPTGYGKSHPIDILTKVIVKIQARESREYQAVMRTYEMELRRAKKTSDAPLPEEPRMIHFFTSDSTIEGLADALESNPRGLLLSQDEMAGLILGLNQYKVKGNDREHFLELYNCKSWKINRKSGSKTIRNTGAAIAGGIQTKVLPRVFGGNSFDDGLLPRFLLLPLETRHKKFERHGVKKDDIGYWENLVQRCYDIKLEMDEVGFAKPNLLQFDDKALDIWEGFYNEYYEIMPFMTGKAQAFIPKLITYSLKFAGILHVIKGLEEKKYLLPISEKTTADAIELTRFYAWQVVKVLRLYEPEQEVLNELQKRMIQTLYKLRDEVANGRLLLSTIKNAFNEGLNEKLSLDSKPTATLLKRGLGLATDKFTDNDTYLIWEGDKIEALFKKVISVIRH